MSEAISFFVIEDHSLTNLGIRQILSEKAALVCKGFAAEKSEAFEKLTELDMKGQLPKILILDLFLGEYSGIDILREVSFHFPAIKTIVYSMYSNPGVISIVMREGAKAFVSKAGSEAELLKAVNTVASGGTYIQEDLVASLDIYQNLLDSLMKSEQNVFTKVIERKTKAQIAEELEISESSVENYLSRIFAKTGCKSVDELVKQFG